MKALAQLRVISLFEDLSDAELARIAELCTIRSYEKGAQIVGQQDNSTDVFFVLSGTVRFSSYAPTGREVIYNEISKGGIFGEFSAVDGLPRSTNCIAVSECMLARMTAPKFHDMLVANGAIATRLVELLVVKIRQMTERVFEVSALAVRERVRRELLRLAESGRELDDGIMIHPAPTHYEIAARIGSHREAVTREFNRLEAEHIVEVRRREIRIVDIGQLREGGDI
jgi:CRP/FNR family cyclic AMP-dependent transcriptional regulator